MDNKLPNFLIVGAAKSGTTSLYHYLKRHPNVYMPDKIKETFFFTGENFEDINPVGGNYGRGVITSLNEYKKLFEVPENTIAIGEACVGYLYFYKKSINNIKQVLSNPKIIIILRNPIDRAFSNYLHHVKDGFEEHTFEDALKLEDEREKDKWWWGYQLTKAGFYYNQVKAYTENFKQVKVYLHDDLKHDAVGLIKNIYEFLEVNSSFTHGIMKIKYNVSGIPKNKFIHYFLAKPNPFKTAIKTMVNPFLPEEKRKKLSQILMLKNLEKPQMKPQTREYLKNLYREDILELQDLINRDLSHWLL